LRKLYSGVAIADVETTFKDARNTLPLVSGLAVSHAGSAGAGSSASAWSADTVPRVVEFRSAFPLSFVPRGVYRFKCHQEADEWLWKMLTCSR
jgi:hypothetical protein